MELLFPLLILALLVPTFLGVRRQKKEMAKVAELQDSLRIGDRVMTTRRTRSNSRSHRAS